MKLVTLGGAAAGPNPGQGCSGCYVECSGTRLVLDLGPGTLVELLRHVEAQRLDGVIISHLHVDHVLDLIALCWHLAHSPAPPDSPVRVWLPPGSASFRRHAAAAFAPPGQEETFFASAFELAEYEPDQPLVVGEATIRFAPTVHYVPGWAMRVSPRAGRDLVYTSDTGPAADLAGFARGAAVIVAETMLLAPPDEPEHERAARRMSTAADGGRLAADAGADVLVLTHLAPEHPVERYVEQAAARFAGRIEVARPGLVIQW